MVQQRTKNINKLEGAVTHQYGAMVERRLEGEMYCCYSLYNQTVQKTFLIQRLIGWLVVWLTGFRVQQILLLPYSCEHNIESINISSNSIFLE